MSLTTEQLDWLVREVVRRLVTHEHDGDLTANQSNIEPHNVPTGQRATKSEPEGLGSHSVTTRVITLETLQSIPSHIRQLELPRRAVITPSARDELRSRDIAIDWTNDGTASPTDQGASRDVTLATTCPQFDLSRPLPDQQSDRLTSRRFEAVIAELTERVRRPTAHGILFSQWAAKAACELNRHRHVTALTARDREGLQDDLESITPNLLVVDLRHRSDSIGAICQMFLDQSNHAPLPRSRP